MKITDIVHADTGKTRTDGNYPQRIGRVVEFFTEPNIGAPMMLLFPDTTGRSVGICCFTSEIQNIIETDTVIAVYTLNSVYYFEKNCGEQDMADEIIKVLEYITSNGVFKFVIIMFGLYLLFKD